MKAFEEDEEFLDWLDSATEKEVSEHIANELDKIEIEQDTSEALSEIDLDEESD